MTTRIKPPGPAANKDPKLRLIRKAMSNVTAGTYGIGGRIKTRNKARPITLPKIKG